MNSDIAIFSSKLSVLLPSRVAAAALSNGLESASVPKLVQALVAGLTEQVSEIPGITPRIIGAAIHALRTAYVDSFRDVWIVAAALSAAGLFSQSTGALFVRAV